MIKLSVEPPTESDFDTSHGVLTETHWWSPGISRAMVARACAAPAS